MLIECNRCAKYDTVDSMVWIGGSSGAQGCRAEIGPIPGVVFGPFVSQGNVEILVQASKGGKNTSKRCTRQMPVLQYNRRGDSWS